MLSGIADRVRTSSKSFSLIEPIVGLVNANQHRNPSDQVQACLMLAVIYATELDLDLPHELAKAQRALTQAEPSYQRDIVGVRDFIRRKLAGGYGG
jgi:hypothetical protein